MWWKKPYINRRDWILENLGNLNLSANQVVVVLMIDYMNQKDSAITLESLAKATGLDISVVDETIHNLMGQNVVKVQTARNKIDFSLDNLFSDSFIYEFIEQDIIEVFESEFGRLLSQNELMMMNGWLSKYSQDEILEALRNALIYQKLSMKYIDRILTNSHQKDQ